MKILLGIFSINDKVLKISETLKLLGHDVTIWYEDTFTETATYINKKLYKVGFKKKYNEYNQSRKEDLYQKVDNLNPEMILFVNIPESILQPEDIKTISLHYHIAVWFVDGLVEKTTLMVKYCSFINKVFVFEPADVKELKKLGIDNVEYMPVGYNNVYKEAKLYKDKKYDIAFIGTPYKNRLMYMEKLAKYALDNNITSYFAAPMDFTRYPWKKYIMSKKYPNLMKLIHNERLSPEAVAEIYANSKICINIHADRNKGLNPRTFEIMAAGAFLLMDKREDYCNLVHPSIDCDIFTDADEAINKIDYYLKNEIKMYEMALLGKQIVHDISMDKILCEVIYRI